MTSKRIRAEIKYIYVYGHRFKYVCVYMVRVRVRVQSNPANGWASQSEHSTG